MSGKRIQLKRGTTAQNSTFTGLNGEVTVDTTKKTLVVHDGTTIGGTVLAKDSDVVLKVDKVVGKQLSTEDYTTAEKSKLSGIASGANNYTHPASGVGAGTYRSVTVDTNGHVTAGTNPTTVSGYGLTDAHTKTEVNTLLALKINNSEKGVANGVATLDVNGKVTLTQIPDSVLGQLEYMGTWNFTTMPTATQKGQYWIANTGGNDYVVGDWAVWNGSSFDKVDNTDAVVSVAGRIGNVVLTKSDVGLANVDNTADATKNVLSATKWTTPRNIALTGDVTGNINIDGSANVSIATTIALNSVALGSDTTGNYVAGNTAGTGITVTGTAGEGWSPTISIDSIVATLTGAQTLTNKTLQDSTTFIVDNTDATKKVQFDVAGVTTATTRTMTIPNVNGTIVTTGDTGTVTSTMIADGTIVNTDINASAGIVDTKLATISTAGKVSNSATTATNLNTASAIVARDASGNFSAGTVTASLNGNSSTSTTLQTPRTVSMSGAITGTATSFDGSANITIPTTVSTTQGGIVYGSSATAYGTTAAGTSGYILSSNGSSAPTWVENTLLAFPGSTFKKSARVATTAALTLNAATATIDGVTLTAIDRVLIKNQATASQNGIYTGVTTTTWTRTTDSDSSSDIASAIIAIDKGTANGGRLFTNTFKATNALGTTAMAWYEVVYNSGTWAISTTGSAATLTTGRTIGMTGDVAWTSASFNGSANVTGTSTLANTGVVAGTYKSVTTDAKGRITGGTNPTTISGFGITDAYTKTETDTSISTAISNLVATAPATLDTLNELAAALGNDPSFATTVTNNIATKVTKNADIVAGTGTKITYDAKGLITGSTTLSTTDIPSLDAGKITTGVFPVSVGGTGVATLTGIVKGNGTGAMTAAIAGTDYVIPSGSISGNAGTATALQTTSTFSATGDVTATAQNFNGSANVVLPLVLANSGVSAGTYSKVTVDGKGRVTAGLTPTMEDIPDATFKRSVRAATTANITLSAPQTIDGIALVAGDRVLVKDQTTASQNGIYIVNAAAWTRALDANTSSKIASALVAVDSGAVNGGKLFDNDFKTTDTLGTTAMTWAFNVDSGHLLTSPSTSIGAVAYNGTAAAAGKFDGGSTTPTGTARLNYGGYFYPAYLNLLGSADTAIASSHVFVETASDGYVRPKTLANFKTEMFASPTLVTPNIGVATGISFNSITGLASVAPLVAGTATVGTSTLTARQDHVHPVQTTVSGNATTATTLQTARTISGVLFNGSANINIEDRLGTAIASAATTTVGTAGLGDYMHITGTTTITSLGTAGATGIRRTLIFDGALTLTHNATSLICPGAANIVTVAGTVIEVVAESTANWRVVSVTHPSIGMAELGYLDGVTSAIQTQLNAKAALASPALTGIPTAPTAAAGTNTTQIATTAFVKNNVPDVVSASETGAGIIEIATTAEAQAGTDDTRAITPLKLKNALNATGTAPMFACRAWVNFNGTGTVAIRASGNVSSITDNGVGSYTVNFTTAMPDVNYGVFGLSSINGITDYRGWSIGTPYNNFNQTTSSVQVLCVRDSSEVQAGSLDDPISVNISIFR